MNIASLQKYEQFELERKKKREKVNTVRKLAPPYISIVDAPNKKFMVLPDVKKFEKAERKVGLSLFNSSHLFDKTGDLLDLGLFSFRDSCLSFSIV